MITKLLKRIIFAFAIIYGLNLMLRGFNIMVPINYYTLLIVVILGFPGLVAITLSFIFLI